MAMTSRFPSSFEPNPLTRALRRARAAGQPLLDLTVTNPTRAGFHYNPDLLATARGAAIARSTSRAARAGDRRAGRVRRLPPPRTSRSPPDRIVLTASTSEAYAWLFKLCCRPTDDEVLIPAPSYPLFDHLTRMDGVRAVPYRLDYHGRWALDFASLDDAWSDVVRARCWSVSPNNPTGSVLGAEELQAIGERCAERDAVLIVDEVFADYPLRSGARDGGGHAECVPLRPAGRAVEVGRAAAGEAGMDGGGRAERAGGEALEQLELIADTYLSVSTPVQVAAPALIAVRRRRCARRFSRACGATTRRSAAPRRRHPAVDVLTADAGWSAVLRVPARRPEEELVLDSPRAGRRPRAPRLLLRLRPRLSS